MRRNARIVALLATSHTLGFYVAMGLLMFVEVPDQNRELVAAMIGHLSGFVAGVVTYHFGSSSESAEKNTAIAALSESAKSSAAALNPDPPTRLPPGESVTIQAEDPPP